MQQTILDIVSLDMDARGIGHLKNEDGSKGKVIFVEGALPGERVSFLSYRRKAKWEAATMTALHKESAMRVKPKCAYVGVCGGCVMQHLEPTAQVAIKQRVLEDSLKHIGKVQPDNILRPVYGPTWGYRYRARLSVRLVKKKDTVLVGFHERKSAFVADMQTCEILPPHVSAMLMPLRGLIAALSITEQVPQIELAVGEGLTAMVLRIMAPLTSADEDLLRAFANQYQVQWWLQTGGVDTVRCFYPVGPEVTQLHYTLPDFAVRMPFKPTDFTQVNHQINRMLVSYALGLLAVQPNDRVADLFCGIGNFTLPLARQAREVVGIEGSAVLTERALENAKLNGLDGHTSFYARNLFDASADDFVALGRFDRMLIDPPREGAMAVCEALAVLAPELKPARIVYVSCNPATLARDADILVHQGGYSLRQAGVINMFPHTSHVESIAEFNLMN